MHRATPSRTALRVALRRAAHQCIDSHPLVFPDPYAIPILGPLSAELARTPRRGSSAALRAWVVARSRFAEDTLAHAAASRGVRQYLLLGAGLDTFLLRSPHPTLTLFEVDHPATQLWKRDLLTAASLSSVGTTFVPVDFERQDLRAELLAHGFDPTLPTQVSWLGVVPYLTSSAFRATVQFVSSLASGSGLVLDYGLPRHLLSPQEQREQESLAARVALAGEPFQLFLSPDQMRAELAAFRQIEDMDREDLNARYFSRRADGLHILGKAGRLLAAVL